MIEPQPAGSFQRRSYGVAKAFLHTVVVVDDQAEIYGSYATSGPIEIETVREPDPNNIVDLASDDAAEILLEQGRASTPVTGVEAADRVMHPKDPLHDLDAKMLVDAFAEQDIVCSVLCPVQKGERLEQRVLRLASRADLVVLDWVIDEDDGDRTLGIVREILAADTERLRLIAIYTAEVDLDRIRSRLASAVPVGRPGAFWDDSVAFTLTFDAVRIAVFAKKQENGTVEGGTYIAGFSGRQVTPNELPERLIEEFSQLAGGLVPNLALRALAELRSTTYPILHNLHKGLDAPHLTHRACLPHAEDAQEHLLAIIAGEIHAVLEQRGVGDEAGTEAVASWWEAAKARSDKSIELPKLTEEQTRAFIVEGQPPTGYDTSGISNLQDRSVKLITKILSGQPDSSDEGIDSADQEYAMRMMVRARYVDATRPPILRLGTIVQLVASPGEGGFWLCMLPLCNSVRLKTETAFPFLPLNQLNRTKGMDLVVRVEDNSYQHLHVDVSPTSCWMVSFTPDRQREVVLAISEGNALVFHSTTDRSFRWIAELKPDQAQHWANQYATMLGRVGVDQSEWLRRLSQRN